MMHKPIQFKNLSLSFPHKICFEDFNAEILHSSRIAIIGRNGSGKSSLLKILQNSFEATSGVIKTPDDLRIGYVPQVIDNFETRSGGERLNAAITEALIKDPNILLLDEPTNHLDHSNRQSLMRLLHSFTGTLIIVSHDVELLRHCVDTLWHIDDRKIHIFTGHYDDYLREMSAQRNSIEQELSRLQRQKKDVHQALMNEQIRAAKSRAKGEKSISQRKWPTIVSNAKASRSQETSGRKKAQISDKKQELIERLSLLRQPEIIKATFSLKAADFEKKLIVSVSEGSVSYNSNKCLLTDINFSLMAGDRLAILGDNGSGKSTLVKAIINDPEILKSGNWHVPKRDEIGYLDQHYKTLSANLTVLETLQNLVPHWKPVDLRRHLCDFLFRKNEEVNALVSTLSGGEKARLSLAQITAKTPKLLILDELTNNLDLDTREHVIQVLREYPGSLIVISHDTEFLRAIEIQGNYQIEI
jgi:ATPase subunit of ABC transporter with duplicated ATPase domains